MQRAHRAGWRVDALFGAGYGPVLPDLDDSVFDEEVAYKDFVEAVDVISIIQSKARRFLANQLD